MNYYYEIKNKLINNEIYKKVKDYSKNRNELQTYYDIGKLLVEAQGGEERAKYGDGLIKEYSSKLKNEFNRQFNARILWRARKFYLIFKDEKMSTLSTQLNWSHYVELLKFDDFNIISYYIHIAVRNNLSVRELRFKIKNKEYERLSNNIKNNILTNNEFDIGSNIKHPIIIKNKYDTNSISEKMLKKIILDDIDYFLNELGDGFTYVGNEYKIKIGDRYNYIDILLFNIEFNCYVVVELKVTELKAEHIGQIKKYMNYIDKNIRKITQEKTIGIIIAKKDNTFIMEYCSDERIYRTTYQLV